MKRAAACFAGFAYGVLLTWLCLYVVSQLGRPARPGCELGHCPMPWWAGAAIVGHVFGLPAMLGALNAVAWGRWSARRWAVWFSSLSVLTAALHLGASII